MADSVNERLYSYTTSKETGDASNFYWQNVNLDGGRTEEWLRQEYNQDYNGQLREAFGSFDNYMAYMDERQDLIDAGELKADWWDCEGPCFDINEMPPELLNDDKAMEAWIRDESVAKQEEMYNKYAPLMNSLYEKYTGVQDGVWYNGDGDKFRWNGSSFTKTAKVDDHAWGSIVPYIIFSTALTAGTASMLAGYVSGLSTTQATAIINGLQTAVNTNGDPRAILGSVAGSYFGAKLGSFVDLGSAAANSALSSSLASAIEQGIANGEIDLNTVFQSGLLGGATEIGKDFITSLIEENNPFDFGGLLSEDSELYAALNGVDGDTGLLGDIRGAFNEFTTKYITGGEWWEATSGNYKSLEEVSPGQWLATNWDGTTVELSMVDLIKQGFETGFYGGFEPTTGESLIWDWLSKATDVIPDSWYQQLHDWLTNASSGGTYTTEGGTTITTAVPEDISDDFDCSSVNRQQVAGATTGTECGPCLDGYEANEFAECVETVGGETCPEGQYYNEATFQCEDEVFFEEGAPCNMSDGTQGIFNAEGECYVPAGSGEDTTETTTTTTTGTDTSKDYDCTQPKPGGFAGVSWEYACRDTHCTDGTEKIDAEGTNCPDYVPPADPVEQCSDPDRQTKADGSCADLCNDGTVPDQHEGGLCGGDMIDTGEPPAEECDNGATLESGCSECADGTLPEDYEGGKCPSGDSTTTSGTEGGEVDCTLVECEAPRPDGEAGVLWDKCCSTVTTTTSSGGETDCTLVECDSPRPEGEAGALWDECCKDVTTTPDDGGGNGSSGGRGMFSGKWSPTVTDIGMSANPALLSRQRYGPQDFLSPLFSGNTGQGTDFPIARFLQGQRKKDNFS